MANLNDLCAYLLRGLLLTAALCALPGCGHGVAAGSGDSDASIASSLAAHGVMTQADYSRTLTLDHEVMGGGKLTAPDVDWLLGLAQSKNPDPYREGVKLDKLARPLADGGIRQYPQSRLDQICDFAIAEIAFWRSYRPVAVNGASRNLDAVPMGACVILEHLRRREAVSQIQPLLRSSDPTVREFAAKALQASNMG